MTGESREETGRENLGIADDAELNVCGLKLLQGVEKSGHGPDGIEAAFHIDGELGDIDMNAGLAPPMFPDVENADFGVFNTIFLENLMLAMDEFVEAVQSGCGQFGIKFDPLFAQRIGQGFYFGIGDVDPDIAGPADKTGSVDIKKYRPDIGQGLQTLIFICLLNVQGFGEALNALGKQ